MDICTDFSTFLKILDGVTIARTLVSMAMKWNFTNLQIKFDRKDLQQKGEKVFVPGPLLKRVQPL